MFPLFAQQPTTIFEHMSALAREHRAVNLGQGFPDFGWPDDVVARAAEALTGEASQYPPMRGLAELRAAIARHYAQHQGLTIDSDEVTVTSGATEALAAAIMALISPGDEVLLFQPLYDAYLPLVLRAGGVPRLVRLEPPGWRITPELLDGAFSRRTRLVVFNNPHNPTSRLFDADELSLLARACVRHDAVAISDEVWEHVVFDGARFVSLSALPGMRERTVKIGSAGKIFALTGWKVGWAVAPAELAAPIARAHQFLTFTTAPNLQAAVAYGLAKPDDYFSTMRAELETARAFLAAGLADAGYCTLPAEGTYFLSVDLRASDLEIDDLSFCERAVREAGVAAIPVSALYADEPVRQVVRLCFAKRRDTLAAGAARMGDARRLFS
ncbi:MAG TPA: aminotransferase [Allosphingosinicella sp.]|nr:aminotransferase [Allosphingosinicella sp.]